MTEGDLAWKGQKISFVSTSSSFFFFVVNQESLVKSQSSFDAVFGGIMVGSYKQSGKFSDFNCTPRCDKSLQGF
jgi:hypothetical protein